jgi:4-alpha-glucanotransferase
MSEIKLDQPLLSTASGEKWKRIGLKKRAGVLAALFSLYSQNSQGIGDFDDLKLLIDWAALTGNTIVQLLPMNELGPLFCPYDSLSAFALEPMYISLMPSSIHSRKKDIPAKIQEIRKKFPAGRFYLDYRIKEEKLRLLGEIFQAGDFIDPADFIKFKQSHSYWLLDFALFKVLKNHHKGRPWYEWQEPFRNRLNHALEDFYAEHEKEINFQMWLQWLAHQQFRAVKSYAEKKKVLLKGDSPILVSMDSADVWAHPEFFKLDFAAGAPPDMYCAKGQRWGTPTYNWQNIASDGYRYLKEKLRYAENFYDILRIDHVVGLFRIWSIPQSQPLENAGLNGAFDPQDEAKWGAQGKGVLSVILRNTKMLICAEDLGTVPPVCTKVLKELGIPGNDVERWVKDWKIKHDFLKTREYRFLSVAMLSTHDTTNWPAWWEEEAGTVDEGLFKRRASDHRKIGFERVKDKLFDLARSQHGRLRWRNEINSVDRLVEILGRKKENLADFLDMYENTYKEREKLWKDLGLGGTMHEKSDTKIMEAVIKLSLDSNAVFCINTILDWLYLSDIIKGDPYPFRINTPGTISDKNWSLVLPLSLEELLKHPVCAKIRQMNLAANRI